MYVYACVYVCIFQKHMYINMNIYVYMCCRTPYRNTVLLWATHTLTRLHSRTISNEVDDRKLVS